MYVDTPVTDDSKVPLRPVPSLLDPENLSSCPLENDSAVGVTGRRIDDAEVVRIIRSGE